jgi:hypothetical protein
MLNDEAMHRQQIYEEEILPPVRRNSGDAVAMSIKRSRPVPAFAIRAGL